MTYSSVRPKGHATAENVGDVEHLACQLKSLSKFCNAGSRPPTFSHILQGIGLGEPAAFDVIATFSFLKDQRTEES
jgi:hypothetical protein